MLANQGAPETMRAFTDLEPKFPNFLHRKSKISFSISNFPSNTISHIIQKNKLKLEDIAVTISIYSDCRWKNINWYFWFTKLFSWGQVHYFDSRGQNINKILDNEFVILSRFVRFFICLVGRHLQNLTLLPKIKTTGNGWEKSQCSLKKDTTNKKLFNSMSWQNSLWLITYYVHRS